MFEKSTWIQLPRNVVVGHEVLDQTADAITDARITGTPLVVTSPTPNEVAGTTVVNQFEGAETVIVDEASFEAVYHVETVARREEADFLIGVGGGKAIDIAKIAADEVDVGFVSIPTAASHDGIVSGRGSVPDGDTRRSVASSPPLAVIADTALIADAPWELTTAGCADIISNYTAVHDWKYAHRVKGDTYSEYAGTLAQMTSELLVEHAEDIRPNSEAAAWIVVKALVSSGVAMSIAGSSRPASGAEHLVSHQLDRLANEPALHGHQVGVASIVTSYLQSGGDDLWQDIYAALDHIGAPTTVDELGVDEELFIEALTTCHEIRDRYTVLGDGIPKEAAIDAATTAGVL